MKMFCRKHHIDVVFLQNGSFCAASYSILNQMFYYKYRKHMDVHQYEWPYVVLTLVHCHRQRGNVNSSVISVYGI